MIELNENTICQNMWDSAKAGLEDITILTLKKKKALKSIS